MSAHGEHPEIYTFHDIRKYRASTLEILSRKKLKNSACECYKVIHQFNGVFGCNERFAAAPDIPASSFLHTLANQGNLSSKNRADETNSALENQT